jgi:hydrogenase nickel incorporation protein HypA/HybF
VREALLSAYELAREQDELLRESLLMIEDVPVVVRCAACGENRPVVSIQDMRCATCGTPSPDVVAGRDLEVVAMEITQ